VVKPSFKRRCQSAFTTTELIVAMAILAIAMLPLLSVFVSTQKAARVSYQRAVAMEIIDGEMEILMAGEWHEFKPGEQPYALAAASLKNLPPGQALLTITGRHVRLEWLPGKKDSGGKIMREADAP
jgi:hypothetical protein